MRPENSKFAFTFFTGLVLTMAIFLFYVIIIDDISKSSNILSMMKLGAHLIFLLSLMALSGCSEYFKPTIASICEQHPTLCEGLNKDGWCRAEKAEIIRYKYNHLASKDDSYIYPLLLFFEDYEQCVEKAAQIRHIKYRDKEADRLQGYLTAQREIKALAAKTKQSTDPYLQYFHWSRLYDNTAKDKFVAQSESFDTPELYIMLASIHAKHDNQAARKALYKSLKYYSDIDSVAPSILRSLISANLDDGYVNSAFVWAKVYSEINEEGRLALADVEQQLNSHTDKPTLKHTAHRIVDLINNGQFDADRVGLWRIK